MPILGAIDPDTSMWAAALVICAAVGGIGLWRWSRDRTLSLRDVDREHRARIREQARISKTLTQLMEELESAATRINSQLDARFAGLERLIHDADAKLAMIKRFRGAYERTASAGAGVLHDCDATSEPAGESPRATTAREGPVLARDAGERIIVSRAMPGEAVLPAGQGEILAAARSGITSVQIAEKFGRPIGEVELILELARIRAATTRSERAGA